MMFTNQYKTTFSISDCGKGLYNTISTKTEDKYYKSLSLYNILKQNMYCKVNESFEKSAYSIFETLYFSTLKHRRGLIDLIINVANNYNGTFRIHNVNVQIIISSRMFNEIEPIIALREDILDLWNLKKFKLIRTELKPKNLYLTTAKAWDIKINKRNLVTLLKRSHKLYLYRPFKLL